MRLIGGRADIFEQYLAEDLCFGKAYAKSAEECKRCTTCVVMAGKVLLLKEVCAARTAGQQEASALLRLSTASIRERLSLGRTAREILLEILNGSREPNTVRAARQLLYDRIWTIKKTYGEPTPVIPKLREVMKWLS